MNRKFSLFLLLFITSSCKLSFAQQLQKYFISTELGIGSMIIPENKTLLNDYIPNVDISLAKSMQNRPDEWIRRMNVSYQITTFTFMNQGNLSGMLDTAAHSFGNVYMLTYSLMIKLFGNQKSHFYFIPGWGIAYDTKTFFEDYKNIYIGSHFNYAIRVEGLFSKQISENMLFLTGLKYMHYSNGSFILPNRGVNSITYKVGLAYQFAR